MLRHHPILGHLGVVGMLMKDLPRDVHGDYLMVLIQDNWRTLFDKKYTKCPPAVYLDMWPVSMPFLLSMHPDVSAQFTQDVSMDKAAAQGHFLKPLTNNNEIASSQGAVWKKMRRRMNLGFSAHAIRARLPALMEEVEVFRDILVERAGKNGAWGSVFTLEELVTMLTLDFIGRFTFDIRLHEQTSALTPMSAALLDTLPRLRVHTHIGNVWSLFNPWVRFKLWNNVRIMDTYLEPFLAARRATLAAGKLPVGGNTLVDTLFQTIAMENPEDFGTQKTFDYVVAETKHTLFAGHETTAFSLAWLFRVLSQEPRILAKMCAEHDTVLGSDPDAAASVLKEKPHLIGQLPYTTAVIKESLRINTNVGTLRAAPPGSSLYGPVGSGFEGVAFPTDMCVLWDGNFAIHRNPEYWPQPLEFLPERWLATEEGTNALHPVRNAYRPFELGPRNCVGQHMAMTEMTMVLALVVRTLEVEEAWDEWDAKRGTTHVKKKDMVWGDRLYQVSKHGPPHVKDGMPVHVRVRQR